MFSHPSSAERRRPARLPCGRAPSSRPLRVRDESYLRVLRHPDFRYLFLGQSASAVGDQVVIVALALYITQRTGSPTDLGLVLAAQSLPLVALLLFGGVWADRLPRHRIMIVDRPAPRALLHGVAGRADPARRRDRSSRWS